MGNQCNYLGQTYKRDWQDRERLETEKSVQTQTQIIMAYIQNSDITTTTTQLWGYWGLLVCPPRCTSPPMQSWWGSNSTAEGGESNASTCQMELYIDVQAHGKRDRTSRIGYTVEMSQVSLSVSWEIINSRNFSIGLGWLDYQSDYCICFKICLAKQMTPKIINDD